MDSRPEKATPQVYFVGAGPGAKDLITVRGRDIIAAAITSEISRFMVLFLYFFNLEFQIFSIVL